MTDRYFKVCVRVGGGVRVWLFVAKCVCWLLRGIDSENGVRVS